MMYSRPVLSLAFLLFVSVSAAPAATPIPMVDYMLTARTAKIVLNCDPPSCRFLMNTALDFENDNTWVLSRATHWMKDWGRYRVLDDVNEADLVVRLDCGQPNFRNLIYGLRHRWMKMEVYAGGQESWRLLQPIWKGKLDPVPDCDCRDLVVHILTEYRADIERLQRVRGAYLPRGAPRPVLKPDTRQNNDTFFCFPDCR